MTQLSDEILIAYTDGELGDAQVRVVNGVLGSDAETLARLRLLRPSQQKLALAFQSMLLVEKREQALHRAAEMPRMPPVLKVAGAAPLPSSSRSRQLMPAMLAGLLLMVVGGAGGYFAGRVPLAGAGVEVASNFWDPREIQVEKRRTEELIGSIPGGNTTSAIDTTTWYEQVAGQHEADAESWLARFDGANRNADLALFELAKSGVAPDVVPELEREELLFIGGETLAIGGATYVRLAYRDLSLGAVGVGLYVGADKAGSPTLQRGSREGLNYVRWEQRQRKYELIAAVPHWRLIVIAAAIQKQLAP